MIVQHFGGSSGITLQPAALSRGEAIRPFLCYWRDHIRQIPVRWFSRKVNPISKALEAGLLLQHLRAV